MPTFKTQVLLDVVVQYTVDPAENGFPEQIDIRRLSPSVDLVKEVPTFCDLWMNHRSLILKTKYF